MNLSRVCRGIAALRSVTQMLPGRPRRRRISPLFQRVPQIPERIAPAARAMRHAKNIGTICVTGRMQLRREIPSSFNFY